jgi:hypothetical protein
MPPDYLKMRAKLIAKMDQLKQGVDSGDATAILQARRIIARIAVDGTPEILSQTLRGMLHVWDTEQPEWDWELF